MTQTKSRFSMSPEEVIKNCQGRTKRKSARPLSYGQLGNKDGHLYFYEISVEKMSDTNSVYRLIIVELDASTQKSFLREDLGLENANKAAIHAALNTFKENLKAVPLNEAASDE